MLLCIALFTKVAFGLNLDFINDISKLEKEPAANCSNRIIYTDIFDLEQLVNSADIHLPVVSISLDQLLGFNFIGNGDLWAKCYINILLLDANETVNYISWVYLSNYIKIIFTTLTFKAYKNRRAIVDYNFISANEVSVIDEASNLLRYATVVTPLENGILFTGYSHEYEVGDYRVMKPINIWQQQGGKMHIKFH